MKDEHFEKWRRKIVAAAEDGDSRLGTYYRVNPTLEKFVSPPHLMEHERILITRFRTGSHSLAIEIGRYSNTPRMNRTCACHQSVQSIWHVLTECPLTMLCGRRDYNDLQGAFSDPTISRTLLSISKVLKIPIWCGCYMYNLDGISRERGLGGGWGVLISFEYVLIAYRTMPGW